MTGRLFVVATPIGNLEDVTLRALRVLREADAVLAEDTRRTRGLLTHHGISTRVISVHEHTAERKIDALAAELAGGARYALVTDAGTPIVSDPGAALVAAAIELGVAIEPIPGPSAAIAALTCAGFAAPSFEFVGFLPRSGRERDEALSAITDQHGAVILFEAPGRTAATLADLAGRAPSRRAAVCRELTKLHEEVRRGTLESLARELEGAEVLGEVTIVLAPMGPRAEAAPDPAQIDAEIDALLGRGESARDAARAIEAGHGIRKRDAYARVLGRAKARGRAD
jgi:16S rRNA (cytidine1402-2'-O)-methyltransferase